MGSAEKHCTNNTEKTVAAWRMELTSRNEIEVYGGGDQRPIWALIKACGVTGNTAAPGTCLVHCLTADRGICLAPLRMMQRNITGKAMMKPTGPHAVGTADRSPAPRSDFW